MHINAGRLFSKAACGISTTCRIVGPRTRSSVGVYRHGFCTNRVFCIQESGDFVHSFSSQHLRPDDGHVVDTEEEDIIKWAGGALYFGGADTVRTLRWILCRLTDDNPDRSIGPILHSSHDVVP